MKQQAICFFIILAFQADAQAQSIDTLLASGHTIRKDLRLDLMAKKEASYYEALNASSNRTAKGYRLMILNTNDRNLALQVRSKLLQTYPDQKVYMSFQPPYIKLRFGNFLEKPDADKMRKDITARQIVTGNIYIVSETIEVKPEKSKETPTGKE